MTRIGAAAHLRISIRGARVSIPFSKCYPFQLAVSLHLQHHLAFVLILGKAERSRCGKQVASYLGLVPLE